MRHTNFIKALVIILAAAAMLAAAACSSTPASSTAPPVSTPPTTATAVTTTAPGTTTSAPSATTPSATTSVPATTTVQPTTSAPAPVTSITPPASTTTTPPPSGKNVTIDIAADRMAFDLKTISVPAGANVTINFNNKDSGISHNVSVYQNVTGGQTKTIYVGKIINGPSAILYTFVAPTDTQGDYFFICDLHPNMTGKFTVTP